MVADLTATVFCDSSGVRIIVLAHDWAKADGIELRLTVPPGPALRVMQLIGLDQLLPIYPGVNQALAAGAIPEAGAAPGDRASYACLMAARGGVQGLLDVWVHGQ